MTSPATDRIAAPAPSKMKKLPFKPTALRRQSLPRPTPSADDTKADDELALFRRSKEMEPIMAADWDRQWKKKQKKQSEDRKTTASSQAREVDDEALGASTPHLGSDSNESLLGKRKQSTPLVDLSQPDVPDDMSDLVTPPASKRSRTNSTPSKAPVLDLEEQQPLVLASPSPSKRGLRSQSNATTTYPATPSRGRRENSRIPPQTPMISLESDDNLSDDDVVHIQTIATPSKSRPAAPEPAPPPVEDEEFGEYVRKAEEQRARDKAMLSGGMNNAHGKAKVDILVVSKVPNTGPCCMKFLYDKPLRLVRDTWTALQRKKGVHLPLQDNNDVILTWRRQKVYSASTLLSLGLRPEGDGLIKVDEQNRDGVTDGRTRVLMEAWTPELFHEMERHENMRRRREAGELSESEEDDDTAQNSPAPQVKLRVILKARDLDDVKLTVRPETTVETLVTGFRAQRRIGSDKSIHVHFDGDQLDEHITMQEADIEDMDTLEVHIR